MSRSTMNIIISVTVIIIPLSAIMLGMYYGYTYEPTAHTKGVHLTNLTASNPNECPDVEPEEAKAQFNLGIMYSNGQGGVTQNYIKAAKWFRRAAEQGDDDAQFNLGVLYENGWGVPQSYTEAVKWYRMGAEQGDADAQFNLGLMYARGHGVTQSSVQAYMWFTLSANRGENYILMCIEIIARSMTTEEITDAQVMAAEWRVKTWEELS